MNIYLLLFLLFIVAPIGTIIHESGHLIGAKLMRADYMILSIGYGKRLFIFKWNNIQIKIRSFFFIGGHVRNERDIPYRTSEMIWIIGFGPLLNGIFAVFFYLLYHLIPSDFLYLLFLFNLWLALINVIPFKMKEKQSDGYMILNLLRKNRES